MTFNPQSVHPMPHPSYPTVLDRVLDHLALGLLLGGGLALWVGVCLAIGAAYGLAL